MIMFWDLDGPILDVSKKYYAVYNDILLEHKEKPLSKKKYWDLKRSKVSIEELLITTNSQKIIRKFNKSWIEKIETKNYQKFDQLQRGIIDVLNRCAEKHELVIVTLRRNRKRLLAQLKDLGIIHYFMDILSSGPLPSNPSDLFVGDDFKNLIENKINDKIMEYEEERHYDLELDFKTFTSMVKGNKEYPEIESIKFVDLYPIKIDFDKIHYIIQISDDGAGFPKDILDRLGDPYVSKNSKGMGLGIFISKNLIENLGGTILFYNSKKNNAIVEIKLNKDILLT